MSIEAKIEALTAAVVALTSTLANGQNALVTAPAATVAPVPAPVVAPQPVVPTVPAAPVAAPVTMPPPPSFMPPAEAPAAGAPFTDPKGLITYVMDTYKALGAERGAKIQNVLMSLGYQNINDVKTSDYTALYAGVEALKA